MPANTPETGIPVDERPLIVIGAGGHAAVLIDALHKSDRNVLGCLDSAYARGTTGPLGTEILGGDSVLDEFEPGTFALVNGVGTTDAATARAGQQRANLHLTLSRRFGFARVLHPAATIAAGCGIGAGAQIMAGAVVQTGTAIGPACIVNTGARIDHECELGMLVHIAPGAVLCGRVTVGEGAFVGTGVTVVPGVHIGANARIGAGMTVLGDVPPDSRLSPETGSHWAPPPNRARHRAQGDVVPFPGPAHGPARIP